MPAHERAWALQRPPAEADPAGVPTLAAALVIALGIAVGVALGPVDADTSGWIAAALALGLAALLARGRWRWLGWLALASAAIARGMAGGAGAENAPTIEGDGVVSLAVVGASVPGPTCEVTARPAGSQLRWRIDAAPELCPLAEGDRLVASAAALRAHLNAPRAPWSASNDPRRGASAVISRVAMVVGERGPGGFHRAVAQLRQRAWTASRGWPAGGLVVASVLGMPEALPPGEREAIREAGIGHLLAVSGLHVALAGVIAVGGFGRVAAALGGRSAIFTLLGIALVTLYVGLTGAAPSAVRAAGMLALSSLGAALGRPTHGPTLLAVCAAAMLVVHPAWASDPGLHLSLAAMAALVHPDAPPGLLVQSWRVTWATLPVTLWHFGTPALLGVVANLVAIPVFTIAVLPAGMLGVLALPWFGAAALEPASWGALLLVDLAALAERAPPVPPSAVGWLALGLLGLRLVPRCVGPWLPSWPICAAVVALAWPWRAREGTLDATWIAAGGGRSPAVIVPGATPSGEPGVCVGEPGISPGRLGAALALLGDPDVLALDAGRVSDGQVALIQRWLARRGRWRGAGECRWTGDERPRRGLRACLAASGAAEGMSRGTGSPEQVECWADGAWYPLAEARR